MPASSRSETEAEFLALAAQFWDALKLKDRAKTANGFSARADEIVTEWQLHGTAIENLRPLLSNSDARVRYAAAAYLLQCGDHEHALPTLRSLAQEPSGFIAPTARLLLLKHGYAVA